MIDALKEAAVSTGVTLKQMVMGKAHLQDYMVVGAFFAAGLVVGSLL